MIEKSTNQPNSNDYIQLLEYKLHNDLSALKKVLKWAQTIQNRIEKTQSQLDELKRSKQNITYDTKEVKTISKIPVPSKTTKKSEPYHVQSFKSNIQPTPITNKNTNLCETEKINTLRPNFQTNKNTLDSILNDCTIKSYEDATKTQNPKPHISHLEDNNILEKLIRSIVESKMSEQNARLNELERTSKEHSREITEVKSDLKHVKNDLRSIKETASEIQKSIAKNHSQTQNMLSLQLETIMKHLGQQRFVNPPYQERRTLAYT